MGNANPRVPKIERRKLHDLIDFPAQGRVFPECSPEEDQALAENINAHGLRQRIEILPKNRAGYKINTILKGHRRRKALIDLDHDEVTVRVRYDLADADAALIEQEFIDDNLDRRQLSSLGRARAMRRLLEIERGRDPGDLNDREEREARDRVGKQLGMCGRNAQRYLNVLRAPLVVQQAFDVGKISLVLAEKVATLPDDVQRMIGNKIQAGGDPKKVVLQYVGKPSTRPKHCGTAVTRTIKALKALNQELEGFDLEGFGAPPQPGHLRILLTANKNCVHLIRAFKKNQERAKSTSEKTLRPARAQ